MLVVALGFAHADTPTPRDVPSFNRDIRPILSENCFRCHGPDAKNRQADLRLDVSESATTRRESGRVAVVPGKSGESEILARIQSTDPELRMPPAEINKNLSESQIETLRRWIDNGAVYQGHWAFEPVIEKTSPPSNDPRVTSDIDRFVLDELRARGMDFSNEADRPTLIRRLSLDLTGLPPTPSEVDEFVRDRSPKAYEDVVNRLLASPHYGERMAVLWLDLVRYADSVGYHGDQEISVYPFRDYVIQSFNHNKPFDRFTREQLAGDLLPEKTLETTIASGYNRLGMMSTEGGIQDKEYRAKYASERIRNLSGTWLGLTLGCTECHDHKYDPFTTKEFYSLQAFFADINEKGFYDGGFPSGNWGPKIALPTDEQREELTRLETRITELESKLNGPATPDIEADFAKWQKAVSSESQWTVPAWTSIESTSGATLTRQPDGAILVSGMVPAQDDYKLRFEPNRGQRITGVRLEALPDPSLPGGGPGRSQNGNFVLTQLTLSVQGKGESTAREIDFGDASASHEQTSFADNLPQKKWAASISVSRNRTHPGVGWAILPETGKANQAVFRLERPLQLDVGDVVEITLKQQLDNPEHVLGRFRLSTTSDEVVTPARGAGVPLAQREILAIAPEKRSEDQKKLLETYHRSVTPLLATERSELESLKKSRDELKSKIPTTLVTERVEPRMIRVLKRGNWMDESGDIVAPTFPKSLPSESVVAAAKSKPRLDRLDLANWIVSRENPLTARVFVNRVWKQLFGAGLSKKLDDFGSQGEAPSHPELLDWLASRFMESDWNVKELLKTIVMSSTYRQTSAATTEQLERDPTNRWLGRQGRYRLDAEFVRDNALAVSGLLSTEVGGKSARPYQPAGYWSFLNFPMREYQADHGPGLYRRGVYTHWQRQYLHPSLLAFDAPNREECTADRVRSNTPLQSLVLLNDPIYVEAARALAENTIASANEPNDRARWMIQRALCREARPDEIQVLTELAQKHAAEFHAEQAASGALLAIGEHPRFDRAAPAELAAWTSVARAILNLHATVTRY